MQSTTTPKRILLVNGATNARERLAQPLAAAGYELHVVAEPASALTLEQLAPFDALFTDPASLEPLLVANARLDELRAAARVQQALLPSPGFEVPGVQLAWHLRPCDELAGDLLNCIRLDEKNLGFYVFDVCGHGVSSALLSVQVSRMMSPMMAESSLLKERIDRPPWYRLVEPARVAERLNEMFQVDAGGGKYFTLLYGVMEFESGHVRLVSAGHPGPVLVRRGGRAESIRLRGHPVGLFDEASFATHEFTLDPGDRAWFYSDGIVEAMNEAEEIFGLDELERKLDGQRDTPLPDAVAGVMETVERWTGASGPDDDCTLLALERRPRD